jgi:deoxycytidylate deaminase
VSDRRFSKALRDAKYLEPTLNDKDADELLDILFFGTEEQEYKDLSNSASIPDGTNPPHMPVLKGAFLTGTIDYVRAVHAEMAAITDAARNGVELAGSVMYTTTFPCHDCAKHIVASGLVELIYFKAYPKSLVADLYDDSIDINKQRPEQGLKAHFHSFVGIAPSRYLDFFAMSMDRKTTRGEPVDFNAATATLRLPQYAPTPRAIAVAETDAAAGFLERAPRQDAISPTNAPRATSRKRQSRKTSSTRKTTASKGNKK